MASRPLAAGGVPAWRKRPRSLNEMYRERKLNDPVQACAHPADPSTRVGFFKNCEVWEVLQNVHMIMCSTLQS